MTDLPVRAHRLGVELPPGRTGLPLLTSLVAIGLIALAAALTAATFVERGIRDRQAERVATLADGIEARIDRLRHLTVAMAAHPHIERLLETPSGEAGIDRVNRYLADVAQASDASILYVIDREGLTLAASNHATAHSLVGNAYRFRPYFLDALRGDEARYFAIGATTGVAGYYFARPVVGGESVRGVVVVKIELETLQRRWEAGTESLMLMDEHGVTIAASRAHWRYRAARGLSSEQIARFRVQRKFAGAPLDALSVVLPAILPAVPPAEQQLELDGRRWTLGVATLPDQGWQLVHLAPLAPTRQAALLAATVVVLVGGLSIVAWLYAGERRRRRALAREAREAQRMRRLNTQLQQEITERRCAEMARDEAQTELIQASKLAVLGQMSAAVAHEVNQPLSAIRTYTASARLLLQRDRPDEVVNNLAQIEDLTERLATMTGELKVFARKSDARTPSTDLFECAHRTLERFSCQEPRVRFTGPDERVGGATGIACVAGDAVRIEQVLGNLLANAVDATADNLSERCVALSIERDDEEWVLRVADNGDGLDQRTLAHLFDPFFTTKPVGQGVGLGLAIAYGLVQEMGGRLRVRNLDDGGALFSLRLRAAP